MLRSFSLNTAFRSLRPDLFHASGEDGVLGKTTLIYGQNGAGKTSFSELLRNGHDPAKLDGCNLTANLRINGQNKRMVWNAEDFPLKFAVYNRYYVESSLQLFLDGEGTSEPIPVLHIGESSVAAQDEMKTLSALQKERQEWIEKAQSSRQRAQREIKRIEEALKEVIIAALNSGDPEKYNTTRYRITEVRKRLATPVEDLELNQNDLESAIQTACEDAKAPAPLPNTFPQPSSDLWKRAVSALTRAVQSTVIPELAQDSVRSNWVEQGLTLHEQGDPCKFCKRGVVDRHLIQTYEQHFSKALTQLRDDIHEINAELQDEIQDIEAWFSALPEKSDLLYEFGTSYEDSLETLTAEWGDYQARSERLSGLLSRRLADPITPLESADTNGLTSQKFEPDALIEILKNNDQACTSQVSRKQIAQEKVEAHYTSVKYSEYDEWRSLEDRAERALAAVRRNLRNLDEEYEHVRASLQDTGPMALRIDSDLRNHFGHGHLGIEHSNDRTGYIVKRGDKSATDLSEGERNAIAFLYFLASLEADDIDKSRTVVVIDDPVTSLDRESLFAAFGVQTTYLKEFAQVIFLTHDYEFFRLQMSHLESRYNRSQRQIQKGNESEIAFPKVSVMEIKPTLDAARNRVSYLRPLTQGLLLHASEYHYLFYKIVDAVNRDADDEFPLLGNAARRLVEGFLAFQAPHQDNFTSRANEVARQRGVDPSLTQRVVKFMHGQSHRDNPNPTTGLDFPSIHDELIAVIQFIHKADENHFMNMCKAININAEGMVLVA